VLVEVKKSTNPHLLRGFAVQLDAYQKSEETEESLYLILRMADGQTGIEDVVALLNRKLNEGFRVPELVIIDARRRPPASKR
jgi:hypothetical protein